MRSFTSTVYRNSHYSRPSRDQDGRIYNRERPHQPQLRQHQVQFQHQSHQRKRTDFSNRQRVPSRQQSRRTPDRPRSELIPTEYFALTREHFALIKSRHHLHRLVEVPISLQRTAESLAKAAKPAFRNDYFDSTAASLAEDWLQATHESLRGHYYCIIEACLSTMRDTPVPEAVLQRSTALCIKWARRQLGRRLDPVILEAALEEITSAQAIEGDEEDEEDDEDEEDNFSTTDYLFKRRNQEEEFQLLRPLSRSICTQTPAAPAHTTESQTSEGQHANEAPAPDPVIGGEQKLPLVPQQPSSDSAPGHSSERPAPPDSDSALDPSAEVPPPPSAPAMETSSAPAMETSPDRPPPSSSQQSATVDLDASPPQRGRKRQRTELSQLDLFGEVSSKSPPPQRSRSLSVPRARTPVNLAPTTSTVILGDDNLADLRNQDVDLLATPHGRLNYFRNILRSPDQTFTDVKHFILAASHLDRKNLFASNIKALTHIFSTAARIFPNAKLVFVCDGPCSCENEDTRTAVTFFNTKVSSRPPKNCTVILPPPHFCCNEGKWDDATKSTIFETLKPFLAQ